MGLNPEAFLLTCVYISHSNDWLLWTQ